MALELIGVGVAIAQLLFRAGGLDSAADGAGNALDGWAKFRDYLTARQPSRNVFGEAIARRLEVQLDVAKLTEEQQADLRAAAADVTDLIGQLSLDKEAVVLAAAFPHRLMDYISRHGAEKLRSQTSEKATPFFDKLLNASVEQFMQLAPSSSMFSSEALIRIVNQLEVIEGLLERNGSGRDSLLDAAIAATTRMSAAARQELNPEFLPSMDRTGLLSGRSEGLIRDVFPQVILGEGGLGKSVLSGQIFDGHSKERHCFLLLCSRLPSSVVLRSADAIDLAFGELASGFEVSMQELCGEVPGRPVVIIDTLDLLLREETADDITALLHQLHEVADIVVTCREREWLDLVEPAWKAPGTRSRLPRLSVHEVLHWATLFTEKESINPGKAAEFVTSLEEALRGRRSLDVLGVPLRLAMACDLYAKEGSLPDGLTVTKLYGQYWDRRIRRNRKGLVTASSRAKEGVAVSIAGSVWRDSVDRFVEDVPTPDAVDAEALRELLSEGALKETGLRVSFFHQTFAEFAVAKRLAGHAESSDWQRFGEGLDVGRSGYWGVAGHLVLEDMSWSRRQEVLAQIPINKVEGIRLILRLIFSDEDSNAEELLEGLLSDRPALLASAADLLGEAPERLFGPVSVALLSLLSGATAEITAIVRAIGELVRTCDDEVQASKLLTRALKVLSERADDDLELMASEVKRLIAQVFVTPMGHNASGLLMAAVELYAFLPKAGQAALLNRVAKSVGIPTIDRVLLRAALQCAVPEGGVPDALILVHREWDREDGRRAHGWTNYYEFLTRTYPERWDAVQVRLIQLLDQDSEAASQLVDVTVRPPNSGVAHRDRITNAAKFLADSNPATLVGKILEGGISPMRDAVGSASQVIRHLEPSLTPTQKVQLLGLLERLVHHDAPRAWPALIKLGIGVDGFLDEQLTKLASAATEKSLPGQPPRDLVTSVVVDTLLQSLSSAELLEHQDRIESLFAASSVLDREREAKFYAALTPVAPAARDWIEIHVIDGPRVRVKGQAVAQIVERVDQWSDAEWPTVGLPWFIGLLRVRHEGAVPRLATLLKKDTRGDAWNAKYTALVVDRLLSALRDQEDPQVSDSLLTLLADLVHEGQAQNRPSADDVHNIFELFDLSMRKVGRRADSNRAALYSQTAKCLTDVGKVVLPEDQLIELVHRLLLDTDADEIAGRATRVLAGLLTSVVRTYPHAWSKFEDYWPNVSAGNKRAIIECALQGKVANGTSVALRLARRADCPPALASYAFRRTAE